MTSFFTDPANVPLTQWLIAAGGLVVAVVAVLAYLRRRKPVSTKVVAKHGSVAAGRDATVGDDYLRRPEGDN